MAWEYPSLGDIEKYGRRYNPSGKYTDKDGKTAYYADQKDNFIQHHFQLHLSQMLGEYWRMSAALHYTDDYGYYNQYKTRRTLVEYGLSDYVNDKGETVDKSDLVRLKYNDNGFGGGELADRKKRPPHQKGPAPDEALGREGRLPLCRHAGGGGTVDGGRDEAAA